MSVLERRLEDMKRAVSRYPTAYLKVDNLVAAAREAERASFIELLETYVCQECKNDPGAYEYSFTGLSCRDANELIAIIKGENNE